MPDERFSFIAFQCFLWKKKAVLEVEYQFSVANYGKILYFKSLLPHYENTVHLNAFLKIPFVFSLLSK